MKPSIRKKLYPAIAAVALLLQGYGIVDGAKAALLTGAGIAIAGLVLAFANVPEDGDE